MARAYYSTSIAEFHIDDSDRILGILTTNYQFALEDLQKNAWIDQIDILRRNLSDISEGRILFEYSIPRMGKRVDVVLLTHGLVIVVEFKVGEKHYPQYAIDQVLDYALDLKNFHEQSHNKRIFPLLVSTEAPPRHNHLQPYEDNVFAPLMANKDNISELLEKIVATGQDEEIDTALWEASIYKPTPTIIEAAQALYRGHGVKEISRSDADAINLSLTAEAICSIIDQAKERQQKAICFVTGVPGAGKTLAGLNIANERLRTNEDDHAVFLSGNGPLVTVLRYALAQDEREQQKAQHNVKLTKKQALAKSAVFIQNIHHFRDDALISDKAPNEKVAVFDEAQRAWTMKQTAVFMKRKRQVEEFTMSEPEFLISVMDRHSDWAVIVCLIGGGQEINTGEAGILEWWNSLGTRYPEWQVYVSPNISGDEYTQGHDIGEFFNSGQLHFDDRLHLAVSIRSYRAESVSDLVKAILDLDIDTAITLQHDIESKYPIVITRDINKAKSWLRNKARGTERYGFLTSSGAARLRPLGFSIQSQVDVVPWFLAGKEDVRSSYYLEVAASEFDVQGLELDWTGVIWDADLRYTNKGWDYKSFVGTKWQNVSHVEKARYLKNAYRVLLTRARQGMVLVIPDGDDNDKTRLREFYDGTYDYLRQIGFRVI